MSCRNVLLIGLTVGAVLVLASCSGGPKGPLTTHPAVEGWEDVVADDLSNCEFSPPSWAIEDGVLTRKGGGSIWTKAQYGDFILDLEFKVAEGTNSGVFFRTANIKDPVQTGIEIQIHDSHGAAPGKHSCGAVYDIEEPSANTVKPAGEWNRMTIMAKGPKISIVMNDEQIIDIDLDNWTEPHKNFDGTPNKFNTAYKDAARVGAFGFQDHGKPVWYRNIRVKKL
jgi:hypothetical protein